MEEVKHDSSCVKVAEKFPCLAASKLFWLTSIGLQPTVKLWCDFWSCQLKKGGKRDGAKDALRRSVQIRQEKEKSPTRVRKTEKRSLDVTENEDSGKHGASDKPDGRRGYSVTWTRTRRRTWWNGRQSDVKFSAVRVTRRRKATHKRTQRRSPAADLVQRDSFSL